MPPRLGQKFGFYTNKTIRYQVLRRSLHYDRTVYKSKPEDEKKEVGREGLNSISEEDLSEMLIS